MVEFQKCSCTFRRSVIFFRLGSARQWLGGKFGRVSKLYKNWVGRLGSVDGVVELLVGGDVEVGGQGQGDEVVGVVDGCGLGLDKGGLGGVGDAGRGEDVGGCEDLKLEFEFILVPLARGDGGRVL